MGRHNVRVPTAWSIVSIAVLGSVPAASAPPTSQPVSRCGDADAVRWIGAAPSTPLAIVRQHKVVSAGVSCCAKWRNRAGAWKEVDRYGTVVGEAELRAHERYDVTGCWEFEFARKPLKVDNPGEGANLWFQGTWTPPARVGFTPTPAECKALSASLSKLEALVVPTPSAPCTTEPTKLSERPTIFFKIAYFLGSEQPTLLPFAVTGGPVLTLARLQKNGVWVMSNIVTTGASDRCGRDVYQPRAVFDMNGDGRPELVIHRDFGDSSDDIVLSLHPTLVDGEWTTVATGVHGATA
ncbi:MAG TPA: hypothetical protein VIV60_12615 [Polyangiaceae bacterium]